jgi:hypothetical protein
MVKIWIEENICSITIHYFKGEVIGVLGLGDYQNDQFGELELRRFQQWQIRFRCL